MRTTLLLLVLTVGCGNVSSTKAQTPTPTPSAPDANVPAELMNTQFKVTASALTVSRTGAAMNTSSFLAELLGPSGPWGADGALHGAAVTPLASGQAPTLFDTGIDEDGLANLFKVLFAADLRSAAPTRDTSFTINVTGKEICSALEPKGVTPACTARWANVIARLTMSQDHTEVRIGGASPKALHADAVLVYDANGEEVSITIDLAELHALFGLFDGPTKDAWPLLTSAQTMQGRLKVTQDPGSGVLTVDVLSDVTYSYQGAHRLSLSIPTRASHLVKVIYWKHDDGTTTVSISLDTPIIHATANGQLLFDRLGVQDDSHVAFAGLFDATLQHIEGTLAFTLAAAKSDGLNLSLLQLLTTGSEIPSLVTYAPAPDQPEVAFELARLDGNMTPTEGLFADKPLDSSAYHASLFPRAALSWSAKLGQLPNVSNVRWLLNGSFDLSATSTDGLGLHTYNYPSNTTFATNDKHSLWQLISGAANLSITDDTAETSTWLLMNTINSCWFYLENQNVVSSSVFDSCTGSYKP